MVADNSTRFYVCIVDNTGTYKIILMLFTLPFHMIIIKVLAMDFQFDLPRHKILFSLSVSDAVMLFGLFISAIINKAVTLAVESTCCMAHRGFTIFIACSTLAVSSVSIIALSVERYIACVHSFRLHQILTESRIRNFTIAIWVLGCFIGFSAVFTNRYDSVLLIPNHSTIQYIYLIFVIPTSVVATFIQVRLFSFSRTKLKQSSATRAFGETLELADYKKKQIKIAFMAGIVAFAFIVFMTPLLVVFLYELMSGVSVSAVNRSICLSMSFGNSIADPLLYGFGIADIRKRIIRDMKRLKHCLYELLPENRCHLSCICTY